jgi:hypothetical protein
MNKILPVSFVFLLSGCAGAPMLISGLGVSSVLVHETTGKGIIDHTASTATQKDCRLPRAWSNQPICQDPVLTKIQTTTGSTTPSTVGEIELRYRQ